jgi:predicted GNAT superfamily acetyltransferase
LLLVTPGARDGTTPVEPPPDVIGALPDDVVPVVVVVPVPTDPLSVDDPAATLPDPVVGTVKPPAAAEGAVEPGAVSESVTAPVAAPLVCTVEPQAVTSPSAVAAMTGRTTFVRAMAESYVAVGQDSSCGRTSRSGRSRSFRRRTTGGRLPTVMDMTQTDASERGAGTVARDGVTLELVHSEHDARAAVGVLAEVWPRAGGKEPLPPELAWVFAHSGNYVAIARQGDQPVGAAIGFRGEDEHGALLHSHITGVLPDRQSLGVGYALKQHQRDWARSHGIDRITWTFDPLVTRNAYFNVVKLGARLTTYYVDFYGPMDDEINNGDETDRCLVTWRVNSPAADAASTGVFAAADVAGIRASGGVEVLVPGATGAPVVTTSSADLRLLHLPTDIVDVRHQDPTLARAWRLGLREVLVPAFADGLEVVGVDRSGWYVIGRPTS